MGLQEKWKHAAAHKSEEQLRDEELRPAGRRAIRRLKRSRILKDLPSKSPLPNDIFFRKSFLYFNVARHMVSLEKHQKDARNIAVFLRRYHAKQEGLMARLERILEVPDVLCEKEAVHVRLVVAKEILRYSRYEHEDCWKDLVYWELFKIFKLMRLLKYEDTLDVMSKISIFFSQSTVACKEVLAGSDKYVYRISPGYSDQGLLLLKKEKVKLPSDQKCCKECSSLKDKGANRQCLSQICERERVNIAKRISRLKTEKKELLVYDESKHGELSWEQMLQGKRAYFVLRKQGCVTVERFTDVTEYLKGKIRQRYLKHQVDIGILKKILRHHQLDVDKGLSYLLSDDDFVEALSLPQ